MHFHRLDAFPACESLTSLDICNANCIVGISEFCMNYAWKFVHRCSNEQNSKWFHIWKLNRQFQFSTFQFSLNIYLIFANYLEQSTLKGRPFTCSGHAPIVKLGAGWLVGDMVSGNASGGEVDVVVILHPFGDLLGVRGESSTKCSRFWEILRLCRNSPSLEKSLFPFECNLFNCCCWWKVANKEEVSCRC